MAKPIRVLVDVHSGVVWASTSLVGVDGESWTLLLWQLEEQGVHWQTAGSRGGRAIGEAVATFTPACPHQRDVWHILHACQQVHARLDRLVEGLRQRTPVVARQAARVAAGKRPRGKCPRSDVDAHAAELAQAQYVCAGLRYLSGELRQLPGVVVLTAQGLMPSAVRHGELEAWLSLLAELSHVAPGSMQQELTRLVTLLPAALPHLVLFAPGLDELQEQACQALGPSAVHLLGWAGPRRALLGPTRKALLEGLPTDWQPVAAPLFAAWDAPVRASSVVENWHNVLRPYLAVHRTLSTGMLAVLAVWQCPKVLIALISFLTALANSFKGSVRQKGLGFATLEVSRRSTDEKEGDELCRCTLKKSALCPKKPPVWLEQPTRRGMSTCACAMS